MKLYSGSLNNNKMTQLMLKTSFTRESQIIVTTFYKEKAYIKQNVWQTSVFYIFYASKKYCLPVKTLSWEERRNETPFLTPLKTKDWEK